MGINNCHLVQSQNLSNTAKGSDTSRINQYVTNFYLPTINFSLRAVVTTRF